MTATFDDLGLRPSLREALTLVGYARPTDIQAAALPAMLDGRDVTGQARTGSGKTAAFGLALLQRLDPTLLVTQALVICPTRELAVQVADELRRLASRMPTVRVLAVCGGARYRDQQAALDGGAAVVVGTPGRLEEHLRRGSLKLGELATLVLDEADRLLDMGFVEQVMDVVDHCPKDRQTLLFSATFPQAVDTLASTIQTDPERVGEAEVLSTERLQQRVYRCSREQRHQVVADLLSSYAPEAALVFCETRADCIALTAFLVELGAEAGALHGQLEQRERDDVLLRFVNRSLRVLVATNVAARGLDIPRLELVVVSEVSPDPETHVHRVGRTARAEENGLACTVVAGAHEENRLRRVQTLTGEELVAGELPELAADLRALTAPNRTLLLLSGRKDKIRKGDVVGALVKDAGLPPEAIGQIDLSHHTTAVAIARAHSERALRHLQRGRIKRRRVKAILLG